MSTRSADLGTALVTWYVFLFCLRGSRWQLASGTSARAFGVLNFFLNYGHSVRHQKLDPREKKSDTLPCLSTRTEAPPRLGPRSAGLSNPPKQIAHRTTK